ERLGGFSGRSDLDSWAGNRFGAISGEEGLMADSKEEALRKHIAQIMREKGLRVRDIRRRSAGTITESYVSEILKGVAAHPSIEKLTALARGLGVDPVELFSVAAGGIFDDESRRLGDRSYAVRVLDMMRRIALSPDLIAIAQEIGQLSEGDAEIAHASLISLKESSQSQTTD